MDKTTILKQVFGYPCFREGQAELIDNTLAHTDVLGIMPTGAGKSLCYQVPALLFSGITLVVSPLISLMKDQVNALTQSGVAAAYINSSLTPRQAEMALARAAQGRYKIVYVAPERLLSPAFLRFAQSADISMVTIDEAHCVSQWGQDFRPSYLEIPEFIALLPRRPAVSAFTATATQGVREDIIRLLRLRRPYVQVSGFDRPNLYFAVRTPANKNAELLRFLEDSRDKCGIVYCATRKNVEQVCDLLNRHGFSATRYHAGLEPGERRQNQEDFIYDRKRVMVGTNAFGMGIDKSDVAFVVHYNMPKNLESYYQEAGRAGRDGAPAVCLLLYSPQDVRTNQFLITHNRDADDRLPPEMQERVRENDLELLKRMSWYAASTECLRRHILQYFGEKEPICCDKCSNCHTHYDTVDITVDVQKILSCVYRLQMQGKAFGKTMVAGILHGTNTVRSCQSGLDQLPTYGIMAGTPQRRIGHMIDFLVREGYLATGQEEYPVLHPTGRSAKALRGTAPITMKLPRERQKAARPSRKEKEAQGLHPQLFEELRAVRGALAKRAGVPAYVVFSDATLRDMCTRLPVTGPDFLEVSGVGSAKMERYGEAFLQVIRAFTAGGKTTIE